MTIPTGLDDHQDTVVDAPNVWYLVPSNRPGQSTNLVGGVMTPPYRVQKRPPDVRRPLNRYQNLLSQ